MNPSEKVLLLTPTGARKWLTWSEVEPRLDFDNSCALNGILYRNEMVLSLFVNLLDPAGGGKSLPKNPFAMQLYKYLKRSFTVVPDTAVENCSGDCLLVAESPGKHLTEETWQLIQNELECRKKKTAPREVAEHIARQQELLHDRHPVAQMLAQFSINDARNYGNEK